jgi:hypothetical protein
VGLSLESDGDRSKLSFINASAGNVLPTPAFAVVDATESKHFGCAAGMQQVCG